MLVHVPDSAAVIFDVLRGAALNHAIRGEMLHASEAATLALRIARKGETIARAMYGDQAELDARNWRKAQAQIAALRETYGLTLHLDV